MNRDILIELDKLAKASRNAGDVTGDTLDIYAEDLEDLPVDQVVQAIRECRRTGTFFPSIGEIRNRVIAIVGGAMLVDPEAAWGEVRREARRVGFNRPPVFANGELQPAPGPQFSSPMIARAVEAIGWRDICLTDDDDVATLRAQFRDALRAIQRREVDRLVSGRQPAGPALDAGTAPAGFRPIGEIVAALVDGEAPDPTEPHDA